MEMKITGWSLKFYECLLCMERHSRNRRWLAEFSSEKEEVELVDLPRTARPPSGRRCRIWAFRQGQGREALMGKGVPPFCPPLRRAVLPRQTPTARFPTLGRHRQTLRLPTLYSEF